MARDKEGDRRRREFELAAQANEAIRKKKERSERIQLWVFGILAGILALSVMRSCTQDMLDNPERFWQEVHDRTENSYPN